jgi:hypothetical protein
MCRDIVSKNGWEFSIINTQKGALIKIFRTKGIEK